MWSDEDKAWLAEYYPSLKSTDEHTLQGSLSFRMMHLNGVHYVRPDGDFVAENIDDGVYLCDTYVVKIELQSDLMTGAVVSETGGRIQAVADRENKPRADLHMYPEGELCLASPMEMGRVFEAGFKSPIFIDEFLVPYLFAQSYYATHGTWLWGELGHGPLGLLQWLGRRNDYSNDDIARTYGAMMSLPGSALARRLLSKRCRGHEPCLCGSGKKTWGCCPDIKEGISRIRGAISQGKIAKID